MPPPGRSSTFRTYCVGSPAESESTELNVHSPIERGKKTFRKEKNSLWVPTVTRCRPRSKVRLSVSSKMSWSSSFAWENRSAPVTSTPVPEVTRIVGNGVSGARSSRIVW